MFRTVVKSLFFKIFQNRSVDYVSSSKRRKSRTGSNVERRVEKKSIGSHDEEVKIMEKTMKRSK